MSIVKQINYLSIIQSIMKSSALSLLAALAVTTLAPHTAHAQYLSTTKYDDGVSHKVEFRTSIGTQIGTKHDIAALLDLGLGYNINKNFYLGVASGYYAKFGVVDGLESGGMIPVLADLTYRFDDQNDYWSPFIQLRGGYLLPVPSSDVLDSGPFEGQTYNRSGYTNIDLGTGFYIRPVRNIDLKLSVHYAMALSGSDDFDPALNCNEHIFQIRFGANFRGKPRTATRSELKAEANRQIAEQRRAEHEKRQAELAARRAEAERLAEEDRAARRAQREATASSVTSSLVQDIPVEYFCHVTPAMLEGSNLDNELIKLATLATGKQLQGIIILGTAPQADDVVKAIQNADDVRKHLAKRYYISKELISTSYTGFDDILKEHARPDGTIATIIIQKAPDQK